MKQQALVAALLSLAVGGCSTPSVEVAELVILNAKVATVDEDFTFQQALAVAEGKILAVGSDRNIELYIGESTEIFRLDGQLVTPGLVDAHCHPFNLGNTEKEDWFSVGDTSSWQEVVDLVANRVKQLEPGDWIIGGGWYQDDWANNSIPDHDSLSAISTDNPVFLYRRGGNSAFVNQKALEIAGIDGQTPDPYGGIIGRKANGDPSGFVVNMANNLVKKHFPPVDKPLAWYEDVYEKAAQMCNKVGLTGWHDAGIDPIYIDAYKRLVDKGRLTVRVNAMLQNPREGDLETYFNENRVINYGGRGLLQVRSVKVFFDGALGSRGAALFEPYVDDPSNRGIFEVPPDHVQAVCAAALKTGMQVCPHALGPRANKAYLDAFEAAWRDNPVSDHRFRSEHAEIIRPEEIVRFAELGVIPSIQPIHHTSDMEFLPARLGQNRCESYASPWRAFIDAGCLLPCGSDFAIYSHNPLTGFYAAITRQESDGTPTDGHFPEQSMTRQEALRGYTIWPAYAAFLDEVTGTIEVGKYADLTVFDSDILTIEPAKILSTQVVLTIVGGEIVYRGH
ncbi:MAG: amidohydrolase [bacterium]|nr:amidohydrolase [bacterium]